MEIDLSIIQPAQLIDKVWKCPACREAELITKDGIDHKGKRHWQILSLKDLFNIQLAYQELQRKEHEIMFRE